MSLNGVSIDLWHWWALGSGPCKTAVEQVFARPPHMRASLPLCLRLKMCSTGADIGEGVASAGAAWLCLGSRRVCARRASASAHVKWRQEQNSSSKSQGLCVSKQLSRFPGLVPVVVQSQ